jgi:hypothetical protein
MSQTVNKLRTMKHGIIVVVGSGKTGKSTCVHAIVEKYYSDRKKVLLETWDFDRKIFSMYSVYYDIENVPPGSVVVIEDIGRLFPGRGSQSVTYLSGILSLLSQNDIIVIISVQSTGVMDKEFFRTQYVLMIHKLVWEFDIKYERVENQADQVFANIRIHEAMAMNPDVDQRSISYCSNFDEILIMDPPTYWKDGVHSHYLRGSKKVKT